MAITECEPCGCIGGNNSNDYFKQAVLIILCDILAASGGGAGVAVVPVTGVVVAFGAIGAALTTTGFGDTQGTLKSLTVVNTTDADLWLSPNSTTDVFFVPAYSSRAWTFTPEFLDLNTHLYMRYVNAPTIGNVEITGWA